MKPIKCEKCENTKTFREFCVIARTNYFEQENDGHIYKTHEKDRDYDMNSHIFCEVCNKEITEEYDLFLDRYSESPLKTL